MVEMIIIAQSVPVMHGKENQMIFIQKIAMDAQKIVQHVLVTLYAHLVKQASL